MENDKEQLIKRLQGMGIEIGGGVATDVLTGALLNPLTLKATAGLSGLAYGAINFGQGAYTNYMVQKHLYGNEDINWGEVIASGGMGAIPFMNIGVSKGASKVVGQANTIKRGLVGGAGMGLAGEQARIGIDERRVMSPLELAFAAGTGGAFGGGFTAIGKGVKNQLSRREFRKYYKNGAYASPGHAARVKAGISANSEINMVLGKIDTDWQLPEIDPKTQKRIQFWKSYAASDDKTEKEVNAWMKRLGMPQNKDGSYIYDHNQYLKAVENKVIKKGTEDRIFIGTFTAAAAARAGRSKKGKNIIFPDINARNEFKNRYSTLFDVLGIPDSHFQPHHLLPLKAALPLYHGLVYGSEEWWKLTAYLLKRNIQAGDSMENIQMFIGAGRPTSPRQTKTPPPGKRTTDKVPNAPTVKTPHSIQHAYIRDPDNGIGESGEYFFTPAILTILKNEPRQRIRIASKFLMKMRRGFELTNNAEKIYNGMFDMKNYDQDDLKFNIEELAKVLNKLDNDGYLPDDMLVKEEFQVDVLQKVIEQVEKDGGAAEYIKHFNASRKLDELVEFSATDEFKAKYEKLGTDYYNKIADDVNKYVEDTEKTLNQFITYASPDDPQLYLDVVDFLEKNQPKFFNKGQIAEQLTVGGVDWTDRQKVLIIKLMLEFYERSGAK
tara:strand:- start:61 stop:2052 length:1992 start_codon:yes stop_codon:yes gene_type:complete